MRASRPGEPRPTPNRRLAAGVLVLAVTLPSPVAEGRDAGTPTASAATPAPAYFGPDGPWTRLGLPPPDLSPGARARYEVRRPGAAPARFEVAVEAGSAPDRPRVVLGYGAPGTPPLRLELDLAPRTGGGVSIAAVRVAAPDQPPLPLAPEAGPEGPSSSGLGLSAAPGTARVVAHGPPLLTPAGRFRAARLEIRRPGSTLLELWVAIDGQAPPFHVLKAREAGVETVLVGWEGGPPAAAPHGTGSDQAKRKPSR